MLMPATAYKEVGAVVQRLIEIHAAGAARAAHAYAVFLRQRHGGIAVFFGDAVKGDPGYTPVRGTDYWTDADIASMQAYCEEMILEGKW